MDELTQLAKKTKHPLLAELISRYNDLLSMDNAHVERLFVLQKIDDFLENTPPDPELLSWRNQLGSHGFEEHLQRNGVQRDGSTLVKHIQFAAAVRHHAPTLSSPDLEYFSALRQRNALLKRDNPDIEQYIHCSLSIMAEFDSNPNLQKKFQRSRHFLLLCYAKMEAIKGLVDQTFGDFKVASLGQGINNQNFKLEVAGEETQLVIRVENRKSLANEQTLQTYPVSDYFSEDYYSMMLPFDVGYSVTEYRPVVLTEFAEQGGLDDYAAMLAEISPDDRVAETQRVFLALNDFCLKLMAAGFYHPDIKLSNFLTDGTRIFVSDRKTITNNVHPNGNEVLSTPTYAPPEYQACLNISKTAISPFKASTIYFDMPSFMSYQLGMALKEFMLTSLHIQGITPTLFMQWMPSGTMITSINTAQKNLFVLSQVILP